MVVGGNLKDRIITILEDDVGILADVIVDEILQSLRIDETQLSRFWAGKFVRLLDEKLPRDIEHRKLIIRTVADLLIAAK